MHTKSSWALLQQNKSETGKENQSTSININEVDKSIDKSLDLGDLKNLNQSKTVSFQDDQTNGEHNISRTDHLPDEIHGAPRTPDLADESKLSAKFL